MSESKLAPYARVIMVNPLHKDLPQMVLHLQPTCKCFDHNFVFYQWLLFDRLTETFLDPILGPDVGEASDEDSRRRKLHLSQSSDSSGGPRFKPISIKDGFIFSAILDDRLVKDLSDQDFIYIIIKSLTIIWIPLLEIFGWEYSLLIEITFVS